MSTYLVTGGCGFIGSYVVKELLKLSDTEKIYQIDKMGIGSSKKNLITDDPRVQNYCFDLANTNHWKLNMSNSIQFIDGDVDYVLHLAAESHVDRSIEGPLAFIDSNVRGTANVLEFVKEMKSRMVHVSTDEVYGHLTEDDSPFLETHPLQPRSPYAASKASSDLVVQSYIHTYGINASITRCCNNYGPRQHEEKLIPTVIKSIIEGKNIPVYGKGDNIREWIHAEDHAKAIIEVAHAVEDVQEIYNIEGSRSVRNIDLVNEIISTLIERYPEYSRGGEYIEFVEDRLGHDFRYDLDTIHSKLKSVERQKKFNLDKTVEYYVKKYKEATYGSY
jgi:dTDP-glucose 4,6-dehydratase